MNKIFIKILILFFLITNQSIAEENIMILKLKDGDVKIELYEDVALCVLPATAADIDAMIRSLKLFHVLSGYRGNPPADIDALVETIARFAHLCEVMGERLAEAEINPLFVGTDGRILAADGVLILRD